MGSSRQLKPRSVECKMWFQRFVFVACLTFVNLLTRLGEATRKTDIVVPQGRGGGGVKKGTLIKTYNLKMYIKPTASDKM